MDAADGIMEPCRSRTEGPEISARTEGEEEGWGDNVHEVKG